MKKIIIALLVLGVLVFGVTPGVIGFIASRMLTDELLNSAQSGIRLVRFDRGWFSSRVDLEVEPRAPRVLDIIDLTSGYRGGSVLAVTQTLHHGPLLRLNGWGLGVAGGTGSIRHPSAGLDLGFRYTLGLAQDLWAAITTDSLYLIPARGQALSANRLTVELSKRAEGEPRVRFGAASLDLKSEDGTLALAGVDGLANLTGREGGLPLGDFSITLDRLDWPGLEGRDVAMEISLRASNGLSHGFGQASAQLLKTSVVGQFADVAGEATFVNLDHRVVGPLLGAVARDQSAAVADLLNELLAREPAFESLSLIATADAGPLVVEASAATLPVVGEPLDRLQLELDARAPQTLIEQIAVLRALGELPPEQAHLSLEAANATLANLRANRVLVNDGGDYRLQFSLDGRRAELNGAAMQLPSDW